MNTFVYTAKTALVALVVMGGLFAGAVPALAASFNDDSQDFPTLNVKNPNGSVNNSGWGTSAHGDPGDTISFEVYYHNTSNETAEDVRVRLTPQSTGNGTNHTFTGRVWADNASQVSSSVTVHISESESMSFESGSVTWRPDQMISSSQGLPFGQNGSEIFSSNGLRLGDIEPGWDHQGNVVLNFNIDKDNSSNEGEPDVITRSATNIDEDSARLRCDVDPNGLFTEAWFEYGETSGNLNQETNEESIGSGNGFEDFEERIFGLEDDERYYFRCVAENTDGRERGSIESFRTDQDNTTFGELPDVQTRSPQSVGERFATIRGHVDPNGDDAYRWFEWGTSPSTNRDTPREFHGDDSGFFTRTLNNLQPDTRYYYRAIAENDEGRVRGNIEVFVTDGDGSPEVGEAPTAITNQATNITQTSARWNGLALIEGGEFTTGWFEWGRTASLGNRTAEQNIGTSPSMSFIYGASLSPNTTYYYRAVVENDNGLDRGNIVSFRTDSATPNPNPNPNPNPQPTRDVEIMKEIENLTNRNGSNTDVDALHNDFVRFTITVENTGDLTLEELRIIDRVPDFLEFANAEEENENDPEREVVWFIGDLEEGEEREVILDMIVTEDAPLNEEIVNVARVESVRVTESSNEVTITPVEEMNGNDDENGSEGAGLVFFGNGFFPDSLLGWLLLILLILILVLVSRRLYGYREERLKQKMQG